MWANEVNKCSRKEEGIIISKVHPEKLGMTVVTTSDIKKFMGQPTTPTLPALILKTVQP